MFKFIDKFYKEEDSEANAEQGDDPGEFYMNDQSKDAEEGQQIKAKADEDAEQDQLVDQQANQENAEQVNQTGIPDQIKKGFERLKGISLDDIRVIFNSKEPAKYGALAYAMGNEIHIAPGQEDNLPHEVAHIVQQKQGKVKATKEENGQAVNDDEKLEKEADMMAEKIESLRSSDMMNELKDEEAPFDVAQLRVIQKAEEIEEEEELYPESETDVVDEMTDEGYEEEGMEESELELEEEDDELEEKRALLAELANNTTVTNTHSFSLKIPVDYDDFFVIDGSIKLDMGSMSVVESELNIYFEGKAFEGGEGAPDFKPLDIKLSNKGSGFSLESLGFNVGDFAMSLGEDEVSAGFEMNGFGLGVALDTEKLTLKPSMDVMGVLFGSQMEEAVKKWSDSMGEEIDASVTASLPFEGTFEIPLQRPLSMRIENINFKPEFGIKIVADVAGGFGFDVGASASIESDYADGSDGDEFSTTTGAVEAHMKVIIFGQEFGPSAEAEVSQSGTLWESIDMQKKLLALCAEEAYARVDGQNAGNESAHSSGLAGLFNSTLQSTWTEGVSLIEASTGVNIDAVRGVSLNIYEGNANGYTLSNESAIINSVLSGNERAKMVHEAIVFSTVDELTGQYQAVSGNWNALITLTKDGNNIIGEYDGGQIGGRLNGQIISGDWLEQGESGGTGEFVLQVQEKGKRLYGYWTDENNERMEWVMSKL